MGDPTAGVGPGVDHVHWVVFWGSDQNKGLGAVVDLEKGQVWGPAPCRVDPGPGSVDATVRLLQDAVGRGMPDP